LLGLTMTRKKLDRAEEFGREMKRKMEEAA
jgi:hypothetical protein